MRLVLPRQIYQRLEEKSRRDKVSVEDLLIRAIVKVLEEG